MAGEASSSPSRPAPSLGALPADGLDSPVASTSTTTRELRPRTRPAVASHETARRAARTRVGSGGGGGSGSAPLLPPPRIGTPLARRRTFGGLDSLSTVHENDASELSPTRPTTPLTRSRSEAGIDGGGNSSEAPSSSGPSDSTRRLRRRRTTEPTYSASSPSSSTSIGTAPTSTSRSSARKGLR